jgi:hypothetical protein
MAKDGAGSEKKKPDDLNAVRSIRDALVGFSNDEQERIIRWACESMALAGPLPAAVRATSHAPIVVPPSVPVTPAAASNVPKNIHTFVNEKNPKTDMQLATTIAYYYRFESPEKERRDEIDAKFLRDACRLAGYPGRLAKPLATLNNAHANGLLDRGSTRGTFVINSVGENLVGMTLPGDVSQTTRPRKRRTKAARKKKAPKRPR